MTNGKARRTPPFVILDDGHQLFVRDWGKGQPVVLLAGWAMDSRIWGETMLALNEAGIRTVAYDRRGHGRSTDPGFIDYDALADDLASVLTSLDLREVTLVAHSGASGEAIRYASRHGVDRLARVVLVGATGPCMIASAGNPHGLPAEAVAAVLAQIRNDLPSWIDANAEPFAPGAHPRTLAWLSLMVLDNPRRTVVDFQAVIARADLRDEAERMAVPVTIIHGARDESAPIDMTARQYAKLIPNAELLIYDGVAHGVMVTHAARLASDIGARVGATRS